MLPMNDAPSLRVRREGTGCGLGSVLLGGAIGGLLGVLALWNGLGWVTAVAVYSLGGSLFVLAFALLPLPDIRPPQPALRPAYVRVRRRP